MKIYIESDLFDLRFKLLVSFSESYICLILLLFFFFNSSFLKAMKKAQYERSFSSETGKFTITVYEFFF